MFAIVDAVDDGLSRVCGGDPYIENADGIAR